MQESLDGLVVASATVCHGYCVHAALSEVVVFILHQALDECVSFLHAGVHHLQNTWTIINAIQFTDNLWNTKLQKSNLPMQFLVKAHVGFFRVVFLEHTVRRSIPTSILISTYNIHSAYSKLV